MYREIQKKLNENLNTRRLAAKKSLLKSSFRSDIGNVTIRT